MKKNGFTLAEIIAVLTLAGVLLAVLMPVCLDAMPNTKVLKLKKANNTLTSVINNLISTEKYYKGNLGVKSDGSSVTDSIYLCNTIADAMQIKKSNCKSGVSSNTYGKIDYANFSGNPFQQLDSYCRSLASLAGEEIVSADGIIFYEAAGVTYGDANNKFYAEDANHEYYMYKTFCIDIDKIGEGEAPFGYGISVDGRVIAGARASEWLKKNNQGK